MTDASKTIEHAANTAANPDYAPAELRAALRREKIATRMALAPREHARLSALIESHLEREFGAGTPGSLAFCWPIKNEFDARPLVGRLLAAGWRAAMPTVTRIAEPMSFRPWSLGCVMDVDPYGIPVPADAGEALSPDIVLLPLVAFDSAGFRLGYGGGYFDRTLATLNPRPLTCGVGFELARTEMLYPQPHDIALDMIVTEAGTTRSGVAFGR